MLVIIVIVSKTPRWWWGWGCWANIRGQRLGVSGTICCPPPATVKVMVRGKVTLGNHHLKKELKNCSKLTHVLVLHSLPVCIVLHCLTTRPQLNAAAVPPSSSWRLLLVWFTAAFLVSWKYRVECIPLLVKSVNSSHTLLKALGWMCVCVCMHVYVCVCGWVRVFHC